MKKDANEGLIESIDAAMCAPEVAEITRLIAASLKDLSRRREIHLSDDLTRALEGSYARRLLHRDPTTGYTVVVMTWGPGQQTQLHDHAGMWCVECVVEGELDVVQYELVEHVDGRCHFDRRNVVRAGVGDAGCLIPPFEYHVLRNALPDRRSVSLHVYAGEMDRCNLYAPRDDGWWEKSATRLEYHS